jgi:iron complex transport system ATP-binding protein
MLQLNKVSSGYGKKSILENVTLDIFESEILVLIGLNGSGKSTLLKTLLGLLKPTSGEVLLDKKPLQKTSLAERARYLSLLESESQVLFSITVSELLEIAQSKTGTDVSKIALEAVGLQGYENKNLLELSSGEVRRAFIAHALAANSKYILIDEPFSHLDWSHQMELVENLKRWKTKFHTTFVLAIHELERAIQLADRIGVMKKGTLIKVDTVDRIFASQEVCETFAFRASIDENPWDGSKRLTLGKGKSSFEEK